MSHHNKDKWIPTADTKLRSAVIVIGISILASIFLKPWLLANMAKLTQFATVVLFTPFYYAAEWNPTTAEQRRSKRYFYLSFVLSYIILISVFLAPVM